MGSWLSSQRSTNWRRSRRWSPLRAILGRSCRPFCRSLVELYNLFRTPMPLVASYCKKHGHRARGAASSYACAISCHWCFGSSFLAAHAWPLNRASSVSFHPAQQQVSSLREKAIRDCGGGLLGSLCSTQVCSTALRLEAVQTAP